MTAETSTTPKNIFSGVKILDLSSLIAGPNVALILSDVGAGVIKVEQRTGDLWRIAYNLSPPPRPKDNYPPTQRTFLNAHQLGRRHDPGQP